MKVNLVETHVHVTLSLTFKESVNNDDDKQVRNETIMHKEMEKHDIQNERTGAKGPRKIRPNRDSVQHNAENTDFPEDR